MSSIKTNPAIVGSKSKKRALYGSGAAVLLTTAAVLGAGSPAQAATTYDYTSNPYYSAGAASGAMADNGGTGGWLIKWESPGSDTTVTSTLTDLKADGRGATLVIRVQWTGSSVHTEYHELRNTDGKGSKVVSGKYGFPAGSVSRRIAFQVCNGKTSSGDNEQCGSISGNYAP